jgi:hypothetical protein
LTGRSQALPKSEMSERTNPRNRERLDSWKEIARFLGRDVRTAIRWERQRGLPVHRIPGGKRGAVYALTSEIEEWLRGNPNGSAAAPSTDSFGVSSSEPRRVLSPSAGGTASRSRPKAATVLGAIALAILAGGSLIGLSLTRAGSPDDRRVGQPSLIRSISLSGTVLRALGGAGDVRWTHDFGRNVVARNDPWDPGAPMATFATSEDLDGDGVPDLLVSVMFTEDTPGSATIHDELFAFSGPSGRVLWSRRIEDTLAFRAGHFAAPWCGVFPMPPPHITNRLALFRVDGKLRIAWALNHRIWWPSMLVVVDRHGTVVSKWVHSGMIYAVASLEEEGPPRLLVGGVSNSRKAAFLAVLDARHVEGAGPEDPGSPFECLSCGPARPLRYFVFEPSELMLAIEPYNHVQQIQIFPTGIEVDTAEFGGLPRPAFAVRGIAFFSRDLVLEQVAWSSGWEDSHRELERAGRIDHTLEDCTWKGRPPQVREWTPQSGWHDVQPADVSPFRISGHEADGD